MNCSLSGVVPEEPVISTKSGRIYEKRVILKWLESNNGLEPESQQSVTPEDLLPVKTNGVVRPRPTTATSIPGMLQLFQNEWDALMLETFTLKQQLDSTRQELAHALYQHDAACRVIARLVKERDEARNALAQFKPGVQQPSNEEVHANNDSMEVENTSNIEITQEIREKMIAKSQELSKERKKREISPALATADDIKGYTAITTNNTHSPNPAGVLCVDVSRQNDEMVVSGGNDHSVVVYNRKAKKVVKTYKSHSDKVHDVMFHPTQDLFFSASADHTAKVWQLGNAEPIHTTSNHNNEVTAISLQATGDYFLSASLDNTWALHDIASSRCVATVNHTSPFTAAQFHPDGLILGTGSNNGSVLIWDMKAQKIAETFKEHSGSVRSISFSENGYYLASCADDNTVKLWDLRKLKCFHTVDLPDFQPTSVAWDYSGTYLAVSGADVRVYVGKTASHIATFSKHTALVNDVAWCADARALVSCSMDKSVKTWGTK